MIGGKLFAARKMGNGSKLQETGGPTPAGQPPCDFLPSCPLRATLVDR
jgi:hypothetical protein